jgi:glutamate synthase (NADPH/NADH) large chain
LIEAGLRDKVELWSDGGMKSGADVVKMVMLGANRAGFGSIAMQAIGCTTCRGCHLDTCHVGIATQIDSIEEAEERGLRRFVPRVYDPAVESLVRLFSGMGEEIKEIVGALGYSNLQDLVGRSDLLEQVNGIGRIDLSDILRASPIQFKLPEQNISTSDITGVINGTDGQLFFPSEESFEAPVAHEWNGVLAEHRIVGTRYAAHRVRDRFDGSYDALPNVSLKLAGGSVPGHGLGAFNARGVDITVYGGGEDGVGKMSFGGNVTILKAKSKKGEFINGSVGKSFCYGAQKGTFIVQGNADSRACIRLSGADVIFGGELQGPLQDELGSMASRANLKGFAFEYMTNGRAVVMGDPGPWICAGMTGGMIYQRIQPELGLDVAALQRRVAIGAKVSITKLGELGHSDLNELLGTYKDALLASGQSEAAAKLDALLGDLDSHFVRIAPQHMQVDADIATE